jgi:F0F1-type ATP synthase membrane subunit c/vacuolar-type H+-ATPase subunit K
MKLHISKKLPFILAGVILVLLLTILVGAKAVQAKESKSAATQVTAGKMAVAQNTVKEGETDEDGDAVIGAALIADDEEAKAASTGSKALAAAIAVGLAAAAGAIGMGLAIAKSAEGISRQPEAEGSIRTTLMLGLVFIETAIIYALIVAILIIFVM